MTQSSLLLLCRAFAATSRQETRGKEDLGLPRCRYNDTLEKIAGQPPRPQAGRFTQPMLTRRMDNLALPKKQYVPPDITRFPDLIIT